MSIMPGCALLRTTTTVVVVVIVDCQNCCHLKKRGMDMKPVSVKQPVNALVAGNSISFWENVALDFIILFRHLNGGDPFYIVLFPIP